MATDKTEKYEISRVGAVPVKNSGRGQHHKGDGIIYLGNEPFITTDVKEYGKGYRLTPENWGKIDMDAKINRTDPMLQITLGESDPGRLRLIVITEDMFLELLKVYKEKHERE